MGRLDGKVAFVTGAAGGIGRAICERFLAEGACVAAADIRADGAEAAIAGAASGKGLALACDVGEPDAVEKSIAATIGAFGRLTALCNVAGGSTPQDGTVTEAPLEEFWRAIRLDLFGTFLCCRHGIPEIARAGGGSVINMSSMVAEMGVPGRDCYTAAKGGIAALTRSMAMEYAAQRVRVNAIAPGVTLSPRVRARVEAGGTSASMAGIHRLGFVEPVDIAHLAVHLASEESLRTTGQIIAVDSGATTG